MSCWSLFECSRSTCILGIVNGLTTCCTHSVDILVQERHSCWGQEYLLLSLYLIWKCIGSLEDAVCLQ